MQKSIPLKGGILNIYWYSGGTTPLAGLIIRATDIEKAIFLQWKSQPARGGVGKYRGERVRKRERENKGGRTAGGC